MNKVVIVVCAFIAVSCSLDPIFENIESTRNTWSSFIVDCKKVNDYILRNKRIIDDISIENEFASANFRNLVSTTGMYNFITHCVAEQHSFAERAESFIELCKSNVNNRFNVLSNTTASIFNDLTYLKGDFESKLAQCGTDSNINRICFQAVISKAAENQIEIEKEIQEVESLAQGNKQLLTDCVTSVEKNLVFECLSLTMSF